MTYKGYKDKENRKEYLKDYMRDYRVKRGILDGLMEKVVDECHAQEANFRACMDAYDDPVSRQLQAPLRNLSREEAEIYCRWASTTGDSFVSGDSAVCDTPKATADDLIKRSQELLDLWAARRREQQVEGDVKPGKPLEWWEKRRLERQENARNKAALDVLTKYKDVDEKSRGDLAKERAHTYASGLRVSGLIRDAEIQRYYKNYKARGKSDEEAQELAELEYKQRSRDRMRK